MSHTRTSVGKLASSEWIIRPRPVSAPRLRLFCLPHAGGGASIFNNWAAHLPEKVEVCPVQLPGRESRAGDCPYEVLDPLVQVLTGYLRPWLDVPWAVFGQELGALIAFELARQLHRTSGPAPIRLFAAGCPAPHLLPAAPFIHQLPEEQFLDRLGERPCAVPDAIRHNRALLARVLLGLRSDFSMLENYRYKPADRLQCPITAFGGQDDRTVGPEGLAAWGEHTSTFSQQMFPGDHFFVKTAEDRVVAAMIHQLKPDFQ